MTKQKSYGDQARAVVLAALVVVSVFAGSVAFSGSAAAATSDLRFNGALSSSVTVTSGTDVKIEVMDDSADDGETLYAVVDLNNNQTYDSGDTSGGADLWNSTSSTDSAKIANIGTVNTTDLAEGTYTVYVTEDAFGSGVPPTDLSLYDISGSLTIDDTAPTVTVTSPVGSSPVTVASGETVTVDYDATDGNTISDVTVRIIDEQDVAIAEEMGQPSGTGQSVNLTIPDSQTDGSYDVEVVATDGAGNQATATQTGAVIVDDTVSSVSVSSDFVQPDSTITVTGSADTTENITFKLSDEDGDTAFVTKPIESSDYTVDIALSELNFKGGDGNLSDGTLTVEAEQDDVDDTFTSEASNTTTVDSNSLSVSVTSPADGANVDTNVSVISGLAKDDNGLSRVSVTVENSDTSTQVASSGDITLSGTSGEWSFDPDITAEANYSIEATVTDVAGNTNTTTTTFTLDKPVSSDDRSDDRNDRSDDRDYSSYGDDDASDSTEEASDREDASAESPATTEEPSTAEPSTAVPTTEVPTTASPTTDEPVTEPRTVSETGIPGFGLTVAVLALLAAAFVALRRE